MRVITYDVIAFIDYYMLLRANLDNYSVALASSFYEYPINCSFLECM